MDSRTLGFAALITLMAGAGATAQIPESTSFQPSTYGGAGAPGRAPIYYQPRYVPSVVPMPVPVAPGPARPAAVAQARQESALDGTAATSAENDIDADEATGETAENGNGSVADQKGGKNFKPLEGETFGEAWQKKFPETPDVPQVPVVGVPAMVDVIAPIPYLAYHTTLDGRTHIVPYGPAYVYAPEQLPRPTTHWKRFWSSAPSHKQDMPQVWNLGYYDPMPTVIESEPDWWKRTLGYPRPVWGPMPAASWIGGLPAARLAKTTMHFYEGNYAEDYAAWMESQAQGKQGNQHGHQHGPNGDCPVHGKNAHQHQHGPNGECPVHGRHATPAQAIPNGPVFAPTPAKPRPDMSGRMIPYVPTTSEPKPVVEAEDHESEIME